ncbi:hypothetical protein C8R47DRAFT_1052124 [Mycena vitilis]|nr:hypothetical protein C8R47DRAFT_1052124 [Mycena vitilis]
MKTLLVFCDGTGMDGSPALSDNPSPMGMGRNNTQYAGNVLRLSRAVKITDLDGNKQIVFYQSGVGSEANFDGNPSSGVLPNALGTAVASKIRDAYVFIAQNFETGDKICLFGNSRGAYTARKLSGLIDSIGLLSRENLSHFFPIWRQLIDNETPTIPSDTRHPTIKCVGVWDTVGSVFNEIDALNIADTSLPPTVEVALHAISLHENREKFLPTLWSVPSRGLKAHQKLLQVWFPGAHGDVGGGYERHELSDISVFWMAGEIKSFVNLDLEFLRSYSQPGPEPWGTSQPHNAYMELPRALRPLIGNKTRLESDQITADSLFHESVKYSPDVLTSPEKMLTMRTLEERFGVGFARYSALNEFEKHCKDQWGSKLRHGSPPGNENPEIVMGPHVA